ncbi:hypothetical protein [Saccharothrix lopnurensis]|uniref:Uncharacterized protein n=1 Tax=Saccharothrix lopnurensis TaxID=1670621 RepID=A0ABW1P774_9PSEU
MGFAGRESWQVSHGTSRAVTTALFLRDTLALSVDTVPELPGLDPGVPVVVPAGVDRAAAAGEWLGWWADVLDHARAGSPPDDPSDVPDDPSGTSLRVRPALRAAVLALRPAAADHHRRTAASPQALPIGEVVRGVEHRLGRHVRPFRLVITEVPVRGPVWERATAAHVIASRHFLGDPALSAPALRAAVEALA